MTIRYQRRRSPAACLALLAVFALAVASCFGGDSKQTPTPSRRSQRQPQPPGDRTASRLRGSPSRTMSENVWAVDAALAAGASRIDGEPFALEAFNQIFRLGQTFRVTSIGCPFAAVELGCGATFAVGVSSITPGVDARNAKGLAYSFNFIRDAACDLSVIYSTGAPEGGPSSLCLPDGMAGEPRLAQIIHLTDDQFVNQLVNGGLAQGGTLAGRPKGITDGNVRSEWFAYPDEPAPVVPDVLKGVPLRQMPLGQSVPVDRLLFIAIGCWGCDGPTSGLDRVYRLGGQVVKETLALPPGGIRSIAVRPGTQEVILVTCDKDYCGGLGPGVTDMVSTVHRSVDGGVNWETAGTFEDYASVGEFTSEGYIVTVWSPGTAASDAGTYAYYVMPGRNEVRPPAGTAGFGGRVCSGMARSIPNHDYSSGSVPMAAWVTNFRWPSTTTASSDVDARTGTLIAWSTERGSGKHRSRCSGARGGSLTRSSIQARRSVRASGNGSAANTSGMPSSPTNNSDCPTRTCTYDRSVRPTSTSPGIVNLSNAVLRSNYRRTHVRARLVARRVAREHTGRLPEPRESRRPVPRRWRA